MSVPVRVFECNKCEQAWSLTRLLGRFMYLHKNKEIPLECECGWCYSCKSMQPIEDFSDLPELPVKLEELHNRLNALPGLVPFEFFFDIFPNVRRDRQNERDRERSSIALKISNYSYRLEFLKERQGAESCLTCGSKGVLIFPDRDPKDFKHPNCGGELVLKKRNYRVMMILKNKLYDIDGAFLHN